MEELLISGNLTAEAIDFSLLSLFLRADFVVKSVIIILVVASVYSWSVKWCDDSKIIKTISLLINKITYIP